MAILGRLTTDSTDQEPGFERILAEASNESYSFDLTSATDRFPVQLQEILLSYVFTPRIARAWKKVLVDRVYTYKTTAHK
jgi:hypothetical protein